jgi:hypothetical protein
MLSLTENVLMVLGAMAASLSFMVGLNRLWRVAKRYNPNECIAVRGCCRAHIDCRVYFGAPCWSEDC